MKDDSLFDEVVAQVTSIARDAKGVVDDLLEDAQYQADKSFAKLLSQHPELYAEMRRAWRKTRRTLDGWLR